LGSKCPGSKCSREASVLVEQLSLGSRCPWGASVWGGSIRGASVLREQVSEEKVSGEQVSGEHEPCYRVRIIVMNRECRGRDQENWSRRPLITTKSVYYCTSVPKETAVSDLFTVRSCIVASRSEYNTVIVYEYMPYTLTVGLW
jgi:hypothetical protein